MTDKLLQPVEPPSYIIANSVGKSRCLIVCDHASNRIPKKLKALGLKKVDLQKHIAWDPGTEEIGVYLAQHLNAAAIFACYSRLVVDLNRGAETPAAMLPVSDHITIPGNQNLTALQKKQRINEIYKPYHLQIKRMLGVIRKRKQLPFIIAVHSFTPKMDGFSRPWEIGILWNKQEKIGKKYVKLLKAQNLELTIGENEPYSLKSKTFSVNTISTHSEATSYPSLIIEVRQDLVKTKAGARKWAKILLQSLLPLLEE